MSTILFLRYNPRFILFLSFLLIFIACQEESNPPPPAPPDYDMTGFAKGADVSWITEMEKAGRKFYDPDGNEKEGMTLLRDCGINAIRLRVWVNPADGWCSKEDMLVKAIRAHRLGMRLLIDFHYSDWWADPGKQTIPAAWEGMNLEEMKQAVKTHTVTTLGLLKTNGVQPEWVQVGNETGNGMLWPVGQADINMANYAALNNAGYDAVKSVFPDACVIVHLQEGNNNNLYRWLFDGLKKNGGKWDMIGMSLYASSDNWQATNRQCVANVNDMINRYDTKVMICEVGMPWNQPEISNAFLTDIILQAKNITGDKCQGVFYWEPQAYGNWKEYTLGAFDAAGKPTIALEAFR
ncbi:MAG: arabinogalactan endo-1,4-beta-galactosidase [Dysgonamonadaceae bacterium]|jgi:arabinogalactan endo-1,4-beta-galactosidase|nr:arabinogalactan endo-1,4-beta-galactosidase [Dysgonamonadaceae bacterium]